MYRLEHRADLPSRGLSKSAMAAAKALLIAAGVLKPKIKGTATEHAKSGSTATEHATSPALTATEHAASSSQSGSSATEHASEDVSLLPLTGISKSTSMLQSSATEPASEDAFFLGDTDLEKILFTDIMETLLRRYVLIPIFAPWVQRVSERCVQSQYSQLATFIIN